MIPAHLLVIPRSDRSYGMIFNDVCFPALTLPGFSVQQENRLLFSIVTFENLIIS